MAKTYTAKDITVLEGLEPVRKRPGMYIGSVDSPGLHHLLWEIVDNSVDEAMNGHCKRIDVVLGKDGETISVRDDGRGIPIDIHQKYRKPALELILTTLHAGGKFEAKNYYHSGGLHGVGASVVTALSDRMVVRVRRDGTEFEQSYSRGVATSKLKKIGKVRGSGTTIEFHPDPKIFPSIRFDSALIAERLEAKAYLHPVTVTFEDKTRGESHTFHYEEGIRAYLEKLLGSQKRKRVASEVFYASRDEEGLRIECALAWTEDTSETFSSFVNSIPTSAGGTHENGLKSGLLKAVRNYLEIHNLVPRGLQIAAEDVREGVVALLSCFVPAPQFQGQTKEKLNNPELTPAVDAFVRSALENWLLGHRSPADAIAGRVVLAARARSASRAAAKEVQRKSAVSHRLNLPGKLADCSSTDPSRSELFLVEGDSAGGSAKQARDRHFQAILPLRGKVLNTEQASAAKVLANVELSDIVKALGCGMGREFDASKLRYHRVCLLMDADSDGNHIATLLMTFFYRHLPELIQGGYLYLAVPPLYRIDIGKETHWARDDEERAEILKKHDKRGTAQVQRFKGLGEMNPSTLWETTLDPATRTLVQIAIDEPAATETTIQTLMGREVAPRFELIMDRALAVADLDI
ncbi:MAG: type IIA DNA topoisomerase subunit B [Deltaproteobacteria bacterium]|nr:type IIA DNA topoisomerase subunit B [Deltaproteobacteria bacterium]